jgi:hypothetical protein
MTKGFEDWEKVPKDTKVNWLVDLLPKSMRDSKKPVRVLNWGYDSQWFGPNAVKTSLVAVAQELMAAILSEREGQVSTT